MGKRTGGARGAPKGNVNRLKHGRYSRARIARRAEVQALLRKTRALIRRIEMVTWSQKALWARLRRLALLAALLPPRMPTARPGYVPRDTQHRQSFARGVLRNRNGPAAPRLYPPL